MGEVERLRDGDQFGLLQRQRAFERFELGAFVEDAGDQFRDLAIGIGQQRIGFAGFAGGCLRGEPGEADFLQGRSGRGCFRFSGGKIESRFGFVHRSFRVCCSAGSRGVRESRKMERRGLR